MIWFCAFFSLFYRCKFQNDVIECSKYVFVISSIPFPFLLLLLRITMLTIAVRPFLGCLQSLKPTRVLDAVCPSFPAKMFQYNSDKIKLRLFLKGHEELIIFGLYLLILVYILYILSYSLSQ